MSSYPLNIDTSADIPLVTNNTILSSTLFNQLRSAILAVEKELGIKPSGLSGTVRTRLDEIDTILANNSERLDDIDAHLIVSDGRLDALEEGIGGAGIPSGSNTQIQFNNVGLFGGATNVVYTGGKLRLLSNLQFLNSSITGDIAWTPTSTNKTLTLPNATDTLVGKATTDTLTNKTIDVVGTGNSLTITSGALGDSLKHDGTKFIRFAKGSAGQIIRVNDLGTDLEYASISASGVDTITGLQAVSSIGSTIAQEVFGYHARSDQGGGLFTIESSLPTSAIITGVSKLNKSISNATNATPIVITSTAHSLLTGHSILISSVTGNTSANGSWIITKLTNDTFSLQGSSGNGTYGSGGSIDNVTVTTSAAHGLISRQQVMITRTNGITGVNGTWSPVGLVSATQFTAPIAAGGTWTSGGIIGDGGLTIPSSNSNNRWLRQLDDSEALNVRWFGAKGDAANDDGPAIQSAVCATRSLKREVFIPGGTYYISNEIVLEDDDYGCVLRGVGGSNQPSFCTTRLMANHTNMRSVLTTRAGHGAFQYILFESNRKALYSLQLQGAAGSTIRDCTVQNAIIDGVHSTNADDSIPPGNVINDTIIVERLNAFNNGRVFCTTAMNADDRFTGAGSTTTPTIVSGTISCLVGNATITGTGTAFLTEFPNLRTMDTDGNGAGDYIIIGVTDDDQYQVAQIRSVVSDTEITVEAQCTPRVALTNVPYAVFIGAGYHERHSNSTNRLLMRNADFTNNSCGLVHNPQYAGVIEHCSFFRNSFAGILWGNCYVSSNPFNGRITSPYFEAEHWGGCIFIGSGRGLTIDQPMWIQQPAADWRRLRVSNSGIIYGILIDGEDQNNPYQCIGIHPIGLTQSTVPSRVGQDFFNLGKLVMHPQATVAINSSPNAVTQSVLARNIILSNGSGEDIDWTATPSFAAPTALPTTQTNGAEIHIIAHTGSFGHIFHDSRGSGPASGLVLDCAPGGTLRLPPGCIIQFQYHLGGIHAGKWVQRAAIPTLVGSAMNKTIVLSRRNQFQTTTAAASQVIEDGYVGESTDLTLFDNGVTHITALLLVKKASTAAGGSIEMKADYYRAGAGPVLIGSPTITYNLVGSTLDGTTAAFAINGNKVEIQVSPESADTLNWRIVRTHNIGLD